MATVAVKDQDVYFLQLQRLLHWMGFLMPLLVALLAFFIKIGLLDNSAYASDNFTTALCVGFLLLGLAQFASDKSSYFWHVTIAVLYHILAALLMLFVAGFSSPIVFAWAVMLMGVDMFFGRQAALLSWLGLVATAAIYILINPDISIQTLLEILTTVIIVGVAGILVAKLRSISETERHTLKRVQKRETLQRDRLLALVNSMVDAVISVNEKGVVNVYNAAALNLLDTNQTLTGKNIDDLFSLRDEQNKKVKTASLLTSGGGFTSRRDLSNQLSGGERIDLSIGIAPVRPGFHQKGPTGYILVLRDITKEKSLEEEKDEFVSVVSHELRTPVAIAEGTISNTQLLLKRGSKPEALNASLENAHEQVVFLSKMINDLSTLSRAERGVADEPEEINIDDLLHTMYDQYKTEAEHKGLALDLDIKGKLGTVLASRLYLEEMLQNFITNSIKYTFKGKVIISATVEDQRINFSVKDTGIGISKSDQGKIFQKFYRSEDYRTRETNGTGLGLYVVKKLSSKLQTRVEVKSRLNHGSEFSFSLPKINKR